MKLVCGKAFTHPGLPQPTIQMSGTAEIGGETYDIVARKTSPYYRGCRVEVDLMQTRSFPATAETCAGAALTLASIYRTAGWDCQTRVSQTNIPDDPDLTTAELQAALTTFRDPASGPAWRLWLLVGSSQGGLFGIMFDDAEPHREGAAGFFDPTLPGDDIIEVSARNKKLGEVPSAFLRTLVHEAGHAFNLFHPKHDVHTVPIGTTIMNQTGT
jgi:pimeloyl-ACP methyl ester carboxylesterase